MSGGVREEEWGSLEIENKKMVASGTFYVYVYNVCVCVRRG
jgi:hypothetical protein